jgi:hypothetical protein
MNALTPSSRSAFPPIPTFAGSGFGKGAYDRFRPIADASTVRLRVLRTAPRSLPQFARMAMASSFCFSASLNMALLVTKA